MPNQKYDLNSLFDQNNPMAFNPPTMGLTPSFRNTFDDAVDARRILYGTLKGVINLGGTVLTISNIDNIQSALNSVSNAGGGTVFLQPGTYTLTSNLSIPGGVTLEGVSRDETIISCGAYSIQIIGSNAYTTGTVSINKGSSTVTGTLTVWDSTMVGQYIFLDQLWYEITNVGGAGTITIANPFQGTVTGGNLSGATYVIADPVFSAYLSNLTISGATGDGITVQYAQEPRFNNLFITNCGTGLNCSYVIYPLLDATTDGCTTGLSFDHTFGFEIKFSAFSNSTGVGVSMTNSGNATFFDSVINGNGGVGMSLTSVNNVAFLSMTINSNGSHGVELVSGCSDNSFYAATSQANGGDGYKLTGTSDRNVIASTSLVNNTGWGVNIAAADCDNNILMGVVTSGNGSGTVTDSGTGTLKSTAVNVI